MEETYQLIEGSPTLRDLDAENGFLWCPFGHSGRQNEPGILISRLDDGSYDVRLGTGFDSPERFATGDPDWSWMDLSVASTVDATFADDMALSDWIASETTATGAPRLRSRRRDMRCKGDHCSAQALREPFVYRTRGHRGYREPTGRVLLVPRRRRPRPVLQRLPAERVRRL